VKALGISPLDKDATASLVEDGRVLFAAAEERFSRVKQHAGFPEQAILAALEATGTRPEELDLVAYPFLDAATEARLMDEAVAAEASWDGARPTPDPRPGVAAARAALVPREGHIDGLPGPDARVEKGPLKRLAYGWLGASPRPAAWVARRSVRRWRDAAVRAHRHWQTELLDGLRRLGIHAPLERREHHLGHAAKAWLASGLERALVVTLDGYGSGLAGSISLAEDGRLRRLHGQRFPWSLGSFYELVTSSLGFHPDRHAGKVVGLAAYGDPDVLSGLLLERMDLSDGDLRMHQSLNVFFSRHLASHFPMVDVAAAWQHVLELAACRIVSHG